MPSGEIRSYLQCSFVPCNCLFQFALLKKTIGEVLVRHGRIGLRRRNCMITEQLRQFFFVSSSFVYVGLRG